MNICQMNNIGWALNLLLGGGGRELYCKFSKKFRGKEIISQGHPGHNSRTGTQTQIFLVTKFIFHFVKQNDIDKTLEQMLTSIWFPFFNMSHQQAYVSALNSMLLTWLILSTNGYTILIPIKIIATGEHSKRLIILILLFSSLCAFYQMYVGKY